MIFLFRKHQICFVLSILILTTLQQSGRTQQSQADSVNTDPVAATVNGDPIYEKSLLQQLASLAGDTPVDSPRYQQLRHQVLQSAIQRRLALAYLAKINQRASADDVKLEVIRLEKRLALKKQSLSEYLQEKQIQLAELHHRIAWQISWPRYSGQFLNDTNYESYFNQRRTHFDGTKLKVAQILLHTTQQQERTDQESLALAKDILKQVRDQSLTFAEAAKQHSESPTGKNGGIVGLITYDGAMPREFNLAAFALKPGEISEPVKTSFGYHLIQVLEVQPGDITWQMARRRLRIAMIEYLLTFLTDQGAKISEVEISEQWK